MASDAAGEGESGERWSAWSGGGIMTGESEPGARSDAVGDPTAVPDCGAGAAPTAAGSVGAETSGVTKPT